MRHLLNWGASAALLVMLAAPPAAGARSSTKDFEVVELAAGVHAVIWKEPLREPIEGNSLIVINEHDVVVVDTMLLPSSTRRLVGEVRRLTDKPVRYVINTHWHDDHQIGNDVFRELWPEVTIIGHRHTREDVIALCHEKRPGVLAGYREAAAKYRRWLEEGVDDQGKGFDEARRRRAEQLIGLFELAVTELGPVQGTPPDLTFEDSLTLQLGERTIELHWLGLGNTRGDVIVHLPREKLVATGDLLVVPTPFGFGSYYEQWAATLDRLDRLDVEVMVPGHGPVQRDRTYLHQVQGLLRDLVARVGEQVAAGASLEQTQERVDLADWKERLAGGNGERARAFDSYFVSPAVERAWRQARGEPDRPAGVE